MNIMSRLKVDRTTGYHKSEQDRLVEETQEEFNRSWSKLDEISLSLKSIYGVLVQILQRQEEESSLPKGQYLTLFQSSATQNKTYPSTVSSIDGIARGIIIGGSGNVTINRVSPSLSPNGSTVIGTFPINGVVSTIPFHVVIKGGDFFTVSTDSSSAGVVSLSVWVEPVSKTGKELFVFSDQG